jgi:hypothetical protein
LVFRDDLRCDRDVVDLVFGDQFELIVEFADYFGGGLDGHNDFAGHAHCDLHS